jgi:uncharacterized protein YciI
VQLRGKADEIRQLQHLHTRSAKSTIRPAVASRHARGLAGQGKIVIAGPFSDGAGAIVVYEAKSQEQEQEQAGALAANDPYAKGGVWTKYASGFVL